MRVNFQLIDSLHFEPNVFVDAFADQPFLDRSPDVTQLRFPLKWKLLIGYHYSKFDVLRVVDDQLQSLERRHGQIEET